LIEDFEPVIWYNLLVCFDRAVRILPRWEVHSS
jgi:hypothetical protein